MTHLTKEGLSEALAFNEKQFQEFYDRKNGQPMPENLKYVAVIYEAAREYLALIDAKTAPTLDGPPSWHCDERDFIQFRKWIERTRDHVPSDDGSEIVSWLYGLCGYFINQKKTGVLKLLPTPPEKSE